MLGHLQPIQVVQKELRHSFDDDRVVAVVERLLSLKGELLVDQLGREQVVSYEDILSEDFFDLIFVCIHNPELLEGLQTRLAAYSQWQLRHTRADLVFTQETWNFNSSLAASARPRSL